MKGKEGIPVESVATQVRKGQPVIFFNGQEVGRVIDATPLGNDLKVVLELTSPTPDAFDLYLRAMGTPESPQVWRAEMFPKE